MWFAVAGGALSAVSVFAIAMKTFQGKNQVLGSSLPALPAFAENLGGAHSS